MKKWVVPGLWVVLALSLVPITSDAAIRRVPARYNTVSFSAGYADPIGEYNSIGPIDIVAGDQLVELDGDSLFEPSWYLGFHYGSFWSRHFLFTLGFRYAEHNVNEWIFEQVDVFNYRQYDLDFNLDLYPVDLTESSISPFVGVGFRAGLTSFEPKGYESESEITLALAANFGGDLKIFAAPDSRSFVTLASVNSVEIFGSDDRPKYLNIGGAIRYWFR